MTRPMTMTFFEYGKWMCMLHTLLSMTSGVAFAGASASSSGALPEMHGPRLLTCRLLVWQFAIRKAQEVRFFF